MRPHLTIQEIDRAEAERINAARGPLLAALSGAARGRPWSYLLFGSLARGDARRGSDADIAIVGAGAEWPEAEARAIPACEALRLDCDVMLFEDLRPAVRAQAVAHGVRCPLVAGAHDVG